MNYLIAVTGLREDHIQLAVADLNPYSPESEIANAVSLAQILHRPPQQHEQHPQAPEQYPTQLIINTPVVVAVLVVVVGRNNPNISSRSSGTPHSGRTSTHSTPNSTPHSTIHSTSHSNSGTPHRSSSRPSSYPNSTPPCRYMIERETITLCRLVPVQAVRGVLAVRGMLAGRLGVLAWQMGMLEIQLVVVVRITPISLRRLVAMHAALGVLVGRLGMLAGHLVVVQCKIRVGSLL
jgi:hypothetical protein